jgi:antirestriction protein ArdC
VKDETKNFVTKQTRASLLHIIDTSRLITVLKNDKRAIFSAAAHAQRAVDYLHGLQPQPQPTEEPTEEPREKDRAAA